MANSAYASFGKRCAFIGRPACAENQFFCTGV
jgi:hypothetical protein